MNWPVIIVSLGWIMTVLAYKYSRDGWRRYSELIEADRDKWLGRATWLAQRLKDPKPFRVQKQGAAIFPTKDSPKSIIVITNPAIEQIMNAADAAIKESEK